MKASALFLAVVSGLLVVASPDIALAGVVVSPVPEPTALLVWGVLAGAGGLFFWRRNREN